ncbi:MAG: DNA-binding response regulator [Calditrichaeota bacterium]|nr:MAG: DNA-binding response regulator [Calditrichota bacterium]
MKVLIVEDEARVARFIRKGLKEAGHQADIATDAEQVRDIEIDGKYDVILMDWILPGTNGRELCLFWRKQGVQTPVLMLTCKDTTEDVISALDSGADDYMVKPFSFEELLARIRALHRRTSKLAPAPKLRMDDLELDVVKREVRRGGEPIFLSNREFELLEYLLRNAERVVSKSEIAEHVLGIHHDTHTNIIEVHINHLRNKLNCGSRRRLIHTIRGAGYVMKLMEK